MRTDRISVPVVALGIALGGCASPDPHIQQAHDEARALRLLSVHLIEQDDRKDAISALEAIDNPTRADRMKLRRLENLERQQRQFLVDGAYLNARLL